MRNIFKSATTSLHNDSCHPNEHKNSAIHCLIYRINTYPITKKNINQELTTIQEILNNSHNQQQKMKYQNLTSK
jgi:hypothetical protein